MTARTKNDVQSFVRSIFGKDLRIVDAKSPLLLQPVKIDCVGADPKSPNNCVLSKCAGRMYGAKAAVFWKYYAYLDLINPRTGRRELNRFVVSAGARRHIYDLDGGEAFREGTTVRLQAPSRSHKLALRRRNAKAFRKTPIGQLTGKLAAGRIAMKRAAAQKQAADDLVKELQQHEKPHSPKMLAAIQQQEASTKAAHMVADTLKTIADKLDEVRRTSGTSRPRRSHRFDLTTRNGAAGHYNFVRNGGVPA